MFLTVWDCLSADIVVKALFKSCVPRERDSITQYAHRRGTNGNGRQHTNTKTTTNEIVKRIHKGQHDRSSDNSDSGLVKPSASLL